MLTVLAVCALLVQQAAGVPPTVLTTNPLRGLLPLPKPHYSWPFPQGYGYLMDPSAQYLGGFFHDFVRITGACPLGLATASEQEVVTCATICTMSAPDPSRCLVLNYSPWYAKFKGADPTVMGPTEAAELAYYQALLANVTRWVAGCNAKACARAGVAAVLLDSEKFSVTSGDAGGKTWAALTRKCDLIYNQSTRAFPGARVEWYNRGSVSLSYTYGWVGPVGADASTNGTKLVDKEWGHSTLDERGTTHSVSIYNIRDLYLMRESYRRTVAVAIAMNATGRTTGGVTPWLALGTGDHLLPTHNCSGANQKYNEPCGKFDFATPYDPVLSWQLGNEINNMSQYANAVNGRHTPSQAFAPWDAAAVVCMYPSALDTRASPTAGGSTSMVDHLAAYIRGAVGLDGTQ